MKPALPEVDQPELSVVMVTHGAWELIEQAVAALVEHTECPFELILVDNASDHTTRAQLLGLQGARVLLNDQNRGFGPATNQAAAEARGRVIALLNSDAFVGAGWLEPLLEALAAPAVGAVVPRYLRADGALQEAGALLAQDGTVQLYGEGDEPDRPCYRFRRVVDYGSAVCMVMARATFGALEGFDDRYAPAYYEDADLCMRLAERGLSVLYEPRSTVTHVRYGSGGLDEAVKLSERNRGRFLERWRRQLKGRPTSFRNASDQAPILARDALAAPRLLLCASPHDPGAGRLARALLERWPGCRLTWATTASPGAFELERWLALGVEVLDQRESGWLGERLFHYDALLAGELEERFAAALEATQPQAAWLALEPLAAAPDGLPGTLAAVGVATVIAPAR